MPGRPHLFLLAALAASYGVFRLSESINSYYLDIAITVGVNIILAVSLNLINGYTGQFSLGHAGFMAVGAYTSAAVTMLVGPRLLLPLGAICATLGRAYAGAGDVGLTSRRDGCGQHHCCRHGLDPDCGAVADGGGHH